MGVSRETSTLLVAPAAIMFLQLTLWPVSLGTWVSGFIIGILGALLALGMALIYRSNNVVSFAQADLGAFPATAAIVTMQVWSLPYWLVVVLGVGVSALFGAIVDLAFIRRFFTAPRLIVTVATIGVGQLLFFGSVVFPEIWDLPLAVRTFEPPFDFSMSIGAVLFNANDLLALIVAPLTMIILGTYLGATDSGVAIRAAAAAPDRASMLGIPVKRLQTQVWAIAGGLAFISTFFTAGITGLAPGGSFSWAILLRGLAALVLGRMTNLSAIVASSVALGVLQNSMERANDGALVGPVLLVVILLGLVAQRRGASRADQHLRGAFRLGAEFHRIPPEVARLTRVRAARVALALVVGVVALGVPFAAGTAGTIKAGVVLIFAMIGLSMVVLSGWAGQVSLGQMALVGVGGAAASWAMVNQGLDPVVAIVFAGVVGAIVAVVVGIPALRLSGLHLAVVTLAMAFAASSALFSNAIWNVLPAGAFERPLVLGRINIDSPMRLYYMALVMLALTALALSGLRQSRFGRVLVAQRDNDAGATSYGVNVVAVKLSAFAVSGFIAASAGAVYVFHQSSFRADSFGVAVSVSVFVAAVIGGLGSPMGAILGAIYLRGAEWLLPQSWQFLSSAVGVLFILLVVPDGLGGLWFRTRDHLIARFVP